MTTPREPATVGGLSGPVAGAGRNPVESQDADSLPGYRIVESLYASERSRVFRARAAAEQRPVVIKVLRPRRLPQEIAQLKRESEIAGRFDHPGIVRVSELACRDSQWMMVMDDIGGRSLDLVLRGAVADAGTGEKTALDPESFFDVALQLCDGLEAIHGAKVIHNDISPANVVWNAEQRRAQIIDFGIASELSLEVPGILSPHMLEGTLHYMSPEQTGRMNRLVDYRSDFYSLGVTLYELLAGRRPFEASAAMELVHCHMAKHPDFSLPAFGSIPPQLVALLRRLLAKNAENRYQTIHGLRRDLERCRALMSSPAAAAPFEVGRHDACGVFQIPQKLYGRDEEIETLMAAFRRISQGSCEMLLVAGYSGIGKSAVVHEVHKPIVERRAYFAAGKFDQYKRNIPYASLIQAFEDVIRQLLTERRKTVAEWAEKLRSALGAGAGVMVDLIPNLGLIVGPTEPVEELPPLESQNRLNRLFQRFVQAFATQEHPLVVFLDDLQWADPPTLNLIEIFMNDPNDRYMLFIGAYRDNEVDADHPLTAMKDNLLRRGVALSALNLAPIEERHVNELLADTLLVSAEACQPLARLCCEKTSGNPFFLNQFLRAIHDAGYVTFDQERECWRWDIKEIENAALTYNVVELMITKIGRLPEETQLLLQLAASLGNRFDLRTLSLVTGRSAQETQKGLWPALEVDLIRPVDSRYKYLAEDDPTPLVLYRFLHDRVQQAAYALASEEEKRRNHLTIGRQLLAAADDLDEQLFSIVGHLNAGRELIVEKEERLRLARLNYQAGLKAKSAAAYDASAQYMRIGTSLLPEDSWDRHYDFTLDLEIGAAEASYLSGDFAAAEAIYPRVVASCRSALDKVRCYTIQGSQYQLQGRFTEVIAIQREGLRLLQVEIPAEEEALGAFVGQGFSEIDGLCAGRAMQDIMEAGELEDPEGLATMGLLFGMWYASYLVGLPTLNSATTIAMTRLSLLQGSSDVTPFGYVNYAFILGLARGEYARAFEFGMMAVELANRRANIRIRGSTHFLFATFTNHWNRHLSTSDRYYDDAYGWSLESGDFATVGYIIAVRSTDRVIQGKYLPDLLQACERDIALLKKTGQVDMVDCTRVGTVQSIKNLMGITLREDTYDDDEFSERRFLADYAEKPLHLAYFYHGKIRNAYLFDTPAALELAEQLPVVEQYVPGQCKIPETTFYAALIWLRALHRGDGGADEPAMVEKVTTALQRLRTWAAHCPENFGAKSLMVEAREAQYRGDVSAAMRLYRQAIDAAHETGYVNLEALANELYGEFWLEQEQDRVAETFMREALYLFQTWGAAGKASQLTRRYPTVRWATAEERSSSDAVASDGAPMLTARSSLDMQSILEAAQAVSSDLGVGKVLARLIKILLENSGAQTVRLLLRDGEEWRLEGEATGEECEVLQSTPVALEAEASEILPLSLLRYVVRTGEEIVEDQVLESGSFATDPYVRKNEPRSVMCLAIKRFAEVSGVVYLENRLAAGAFTRERARFVRVLVSQAIISIDNARLYEQLEEHSRTLQHRVEERTRELVTTQQQLVAQERLASLGALTAGIAHELRNPLNFVINFARLSKQITGELSEILTQAGETLGEEDRTDVEECLGDLTSNVGKIAEHGERANQIITDMLLHSRESGTTKERSDINSVLKSALNLVTRGLKTSAPGFEPTIDQRCDPDIGPVDLVASEVTRVFINVLNNACYAMQAKKRALGESYEPRLSLATSVREGHVEVRVRDNGVGIPKKILGEVWNPFFTTKPAGDGTGLGLSICHDIVFGTHKGWMTAESVEGEFTEFVIAFPRRSLPEEEDGEEATGRQPAES